MILNCMTTFWKLQDAVYRNYTPKLVSTLNVPNVIVFQLLLKDMKEDLTRFSKNRHYEN